jgi:thioredoxin
MPIADITDDNVFKMALRDTNELVVIDFYAPWCAPCRALAPTFEGIANTFPRVLILKVDVDVMKNIAAAYDVSRLPTIVFVRQGTEIDRVVGADRGAIAAKVIAHTGR